MNELWSSSDARDYYLIQANTTEDKDGMVTGIPFFISDYIEIICQLKYQYYHQLNSLRTSPQTIQTSKSCNNLFNLLHFTSLEFNLNLSKLN